MNAFLAHNRILYLIFGIAFLFFSIFLIYSSYSHKNLLDRHRHIEVIDKIETTQDIEKMRRFLIESLEYQIDMENRTIEIYFYAGALLLISSLLILGAYATDPNKSLKRDSRPDRPPAA